MRSKFGDNEPQDVSYHGNAFLRLMGYIKPYWKTVALCCVLVGLLTVFDIARPRIIGDAIDKYITQQSAQDLPPETRFQGILIAAGLYVAILLLQFICNRLQYLKIQETGQNIVYTLRNELMAHVESLSMRFFDLTPVGRIVTRITNDTEAVNDLYANTIVRLFRNVVKIIGLAIIMMVMNFRMAMLSFVLVPVMAVLTAVFRKLSRKTYQIVKTRITTLNTFLSEHLSGMRVIQIFAREKEKCAEFEEKNESLYRAGVREMMVFAIFRPSIYFLSVIAMAIILGGGSALVLDGVISIGMLYTFTEYISQLFTPVQELAEQFTTLQSAIASAEKIFTLLDEKPMLSDKEDAKKLPAVRGKIEFDHVWFAYDNVNWVLKDVSFTIEPGQKVAFVGATGAGKSSILNLIGLTIVAMGTSLPEFVTSVVAARKNEVDMAFGNVIGSNIFNILFILGVTAAISPVAFIMENVVDSILLVLVSILVWVFAWSRLHIEKKEGVVLLALYAAYLVYICMR